MGIYSTDSQTIIFPYHESRQCYTVMNNTYPIWIQTRCRVFCLSGRKVILSQTIVYENRYSLSRWKNCMVRILKLKKGFTFKRSSLWLKRKSRKVKKEFENSDLCQMCLRINYYVDNFFKWNTSMSVCSLLKWNGTFWLLNLELFSSGKCSSHYIKDQN